MSEARAGMGRATDCVDLDHVRFDEVRCDVIHAHVTDRLVDERVRRWSELVTWARRHDIPLVVTLHDLPQIAEGTERCHRRRRRMREIASDAALVVVSSEHERCAADAMGVSAAVVPHPVFRRPQAPQRPRTTHSTSLTVAGFIHPGKGVVEFLHSLGSVAGTALEGWELRLVGGVATGHEKHVEEIRRTARRIGLSLVVTGEVSVGRWVDELLGARFAIAPHLHCSASGSILSWTSVGVRPFVSRHPFSTELERDHPDAVTVVDRPGDWGDVLFDALVHERSSRGPGPSWRRPEASVDVFDAALDALVDQTPDGWTR